jgi:hypothetical protein
MLLHVSAFKMPSSGDTYVREPMHCVLIGCNYFYYFRFIFDVFSVQTFLFVVRLFCVFLVCSSLYVSSVPLRSLYSSNIVYKKDI